MKKFILLADKLRENYAVRFIIEPNKLPVDVSKILNEKRIEVVETKTTNGLIQVIQDCFLFIGNDSGPSYIANLLGIPTFIIFGPTNPIFHQPVKGLNDFIIKKLDCSPTENHKLCFTNGGRNGCPVNDCMNLLSMNDVEKSIRKLLKRIESDY